MSKLQCSRCGGDPNDGAAVNMQGPATGHNTERLLLCGRCLRMVKAFISDRPDKSGEDDPPVVITKQRVAERFARKGLAQ